MYLGLEASRKNIKLVLQNRHLPKELKESKKLRSILDYEKHLPDSFLSKANYTRPLPVHPDEEVINFVRHINLLF